MDYHQTLEHRERTHPNAKPSIRKTLKIRPHPIHRKLGVKEGGGCARVDFKGGYRFWCGWILIKIIHSAAPDAP